MAVTEGVARIILNPGDYLEPFLVEDEALGLVVEPNSAGHDAWGFRNRSVPPQADIVAIGDSQTYGIAATANNSWPVHLEQLTGRKVYNMALGTYGPAQYLYLLKNRAFKLKPSLIIVGFYYGNDFANAYNDVYEGSGYWHYLQDSNFISQQNNQVERHRETAVSSYALVRYTKNIQSWFSHHSVIYRIAADSALGDMLRFSEIKYGYGAGDLTMLEDNKHNVYTAFTPPGRLSALNLDDPNIQEGVRLSLELMHQIHHYTTEKGTDFLVVLIPTKESVFAGYIEHNKTLQNADSIDQLLAYERQANAWVKADFKTNGIAYIDVLEPLRAAVGQEQIYPTNHNSHPNKNGYRIIAETIGQYLAEDAQD